MPPRSLSESYAFNLSDNERRRARLKQQLYQQESPSRGESVTSGSGTSLDVSTTTSASAATTLSTTSSFRSISSVENQEPAASPANVDVVPSSPPLSKCTKQSRTTSSSVISNATASTTTSAATSNFETTTTTTHNHYLSGCNALRLQLFGLFLPLGGLTWMGTRSISASIAAIISLPVIAILQGSWAIANYRLKYRDAPLPKAPSHGVVKTVTTSPPTVKTTSGLVSTDNETSNDSNNNNAPLRLLVIGDSLAIGVGQSQNPTPVMPETIAHELSQAMGGRPVLWTCHGAPGASAGWIVRELERSIQQQGHFQQPTTMTTGNGYGSMTPTPVMELPGQQQQYTLQQDDFSASLLQESFRSSLSSDESSCDEPAAQSSNSMDEETLKTWQERLREERVHFDANVVGPFDIAVVLTGSNDLKSAFFPFLLKGEDAEFRRQAQLRGGSYGNELSRLLRVLDRRMRLRLQTFRESVEAATEKVRERLGSHDSNGGSGSGGEVSVDFAQYDDVDDEHVDNERSSLMQSDDDADSQTDSETDLEASETAVRSSSSMFPMVVLPGMPARALPIFHQWPLRPLAVPVVDIMDSHKRRLADRHPGQVLFVDAPPTQDLTDYTHQTGKFATATKSRPAAKTLLNLKSLKRRQAYRIEEDMKEYYTLRQRQLWDPEHLPERKRHFGLFSVDGIHPNDEGYEFWGKFISDAIVKEFKRKQGAADEQANVD